ncbi:hypothetical protein AMR72_05105 [Flavobacterium psychrophilum]|nr:hypothetical protein AMR72_05105 [Flavobacterium psychrophilum]AOE51951.1 hypothetical protein ALW18_05100 [Flavobacterium psychrophilum]
MKNKNISYSISVLLLLIFAVGCSGITKVTDVITNPSARQVYAREFKDNQAVYNDWNAAYESAIGDSLSVPLPYGERGAFNAVEDHVYSYNVQIQEGEVLIAGIVKDSVHQRVFIDIFQKRDKEYQKVESASLTASGLVYSAKTTGVYKVIIQPEMAADTNFFISLNKKPLYGVFPVAGKGNTAIGSFWGMERDGGKRSHEGIDIFAKKGTPVVAVTSGIVNYTGEKGIGGKQVWLRDSDFGSSLYYAHLDSIKTTLGAKVSVGDTLGFVGNTGNARFTPAHLHFGIYRNYGAVNPLPFVFKNDIVTIKEFTKSQKGDVLKIKSATANLRLMPDAKAAKLGELKANDVVQLLGESKEWLHVKTALGLSAFVHRSLVGSAK